MEAEARGRGAARPYEQPSLKRPPGRTAKDMLDRKKVYNGDLGPLWDAICAMQERLTAIEGDIAFVARVFRVGWRSVIGIGGVAGSLTAVIILCRTVGVF